MAIEDYAVERVVLGILDGGMSGRLFAEVRERQGLVYWVGAWHEHPRAGGMIHLGASTTPHRSEQVRRAMLREVDRLVEGIDDDELSRAIVGIVAREQTVGDGLPARASELGDDLLYHGRPVDAGVKVDRVRGVTVERIRDYLSRYPRDPVALVSVGPDRGA